MTHRRPGCSLPPARPRRPTAPTIWTPSFPSGRFVFSPLPLLFLSFSLPLGASHWTQKKMEVSKRGSRERIIALLRENKSNSRSGRCCLFGIVVGSFIFAHRPTLQRVRTSSCLQYAAAGFNGDICRSTTSPPCSRDGLVRPVKFKIC